MGCDVHAFWEIKLNGKWFTYSQPNFKRDYRLFAKMANVRNYFDIEPISLPRGLPNDISEIVKMEAKRYGVDGHSHSWLNADEIKELYKFHKELYNKDGKLEFYLDLQEWFFLCGNTWAYFKEYRDDYPDEIEDIRLVFWFDN